MTPSSDRHPPGQAKHTRLSAPPATRELAAVVLAAAGCALLFVLRGCMLWDSDQAVVGLAARDILHRGAWPVFYSGQEFLGSIETYWIAAFFSILPESIGTFRVATGFIFVAAAAMTWAYSREAYGDRAGLLAGLYLSLGPPFLLYRALAGSGYATVLFLGSLVLWLIVRAEKRARAGQTPRVEALATGFVLGLALWTSYLSLAYVAAVAVALLAGTAKRRLGWRDGALASLGLAVGTTPWWLKNMRTGWASLKAPEMAPSGFSDLPGRAGSLIADGLPTLYGAIPLRAGKPIFPGALAVVALLVGAILVQAIRRASSRDRSLDAYFSRVLLAIAVASPLLALAIRRGNLTEPRYLEPLYLFTASLFGAAVAQSRAIWWKATVASCALVLNLGGQWREPSRDDRRFELGPRSPVVEQLALQGVREIYASYWTAYLVTFASNSTIVATPFGTRNLTRRPEDRARVDASASPGFLLDGNDAKRLETLLEASHIAFEREQLDGMTLLRGLPPGVLARLRDCLCIPRSL